MKVITHNSVNSELVQEKEYIVKNGVNFQDVSKYIRKQYLQGEIDGYTILDGNNQILSQCCGARLVN